MDSRLSVKVGSAMVIVGILLLCLFFFLDSWLHNKAVNVLLSSSKWESVYFTDFDYGGVDWGIRVYSRMADGTVGEYRIYPVYSFSDSVAIDTAVVWRESIELFRRLFGGGIHAPQCPEDSYTMGLHAAGAYNFLYGLEHQDLPVQQLFSVPVRLHGAEALVKIDYVGSVLLVRKDMHQRCVIYILLVVIGVGCILWCSKFFF